MKLILILLVVCAMVGAANAALDPLEIGVGARTLGMGKVGVGLSKDSASIFVNPAGLALNHDLNITSMQGNLLQDVGYVMFGLSDDSPYGSLGLGLVNISVGGIPLTTWDGSNVNQYGTSDYSNRAVVFSYGNNLNQRLRLGGSVKYFTQGFTLTSGTTTSLEGGTGSGIDLDLGLQYDLNRWLSTGLVLQNFLPQSMGGKFIWQRNNLEEGLPLLIKAGAGLRIFGMDALRASDQELSFGLDYERFYALNRPALWHAGLEWWPLSFFALRAGLDQKAKTADTVDNNYSVGVGLKYKGFSFDIAYHTYGELSENATYFFSLGYVSAERKPRTEKEIPKEIGGIPITKVVPKPALKTFSDVADNFWAKEPIEYLATLGIMGGYPDNTFQPDKELSRAELSALLIKAKEFKLEKPTQTPFSDLDPAHWAAPFIEAAVKHEYVAGYPDATFKPDQKITRAEAAAVLAKFAGLSVKDEVKERQFPDLARLHWASPAVAAVKREGVLDYLSGKDFEPAKNLTRAEAAEMLSKVAFVKNKIKKLISEGK